MNSLTSNSISANREFQERVLAAALEIKADPGYSHPYSDHLDCEECQERFNRLLIKILEISEDIHGKQ